MQNESDKLHLLRFSSSGPASDGIPSAENTRKETCFPTVFCLHSICFSGKYVLSKFNSYYVCISVAMVFPRDESSSKTFL